MKLQEISLLQVLSEMPDTCKFDPTKPEQLHYDFFLSALGFEERTIAIPRSLSQVDGFKCENTIYFQYETSTTENAFNEPKLHEYFTKIGSKVSKLFCDEPGFINLLSEIILNKIVEKDKAVSVMFDISVCSSKLILSVVKVLLQLNIELTVVYTEAKQYYPLFSDYARAPDEFINSVTVSNETVILSGDYAGGNKTNPDLIISFPDFKAQRVKNIISVIDETILLKPDDRLVWIVGDPNMDNGDRDNRKKMMIEINEIPEKGKIYEVSTLYYKRTIEKLETIYQNHHLNYHINIADLGSKMQTLAIALYCHIRPELSVYYTSPKSYKTSNYSQGIKNQWQIPFGNTLQLMKRLNSIDTFILD